MIATAYRQSPILNGLKSTIQRHWMSRLHIALLYSLIFILGFAFYRDAASRGHVYGVQIQELEKQVEKRKLEVRFLESHVHNLVQSLADLTASFAPEDWPRSEVRILGRHIFQLYSLDMRTVSARYPREAQILERLVHLRRLGIRWYPLGQSLEEGFDSAGFAAFILRELRVPVAKIQLGENLFGVVSGIWTRLPPVHQPRPGDLVFYPDGYVFFYFEDQFRRPFVMGMTPFGIVPLVPDFAEVIGYRRVRL
jgi:cell division protein FtsB